MSRLEHGWIFAIRVSIFLLPQSPYHQRWWREDRQKHLSTDFSIYYSQIIADKAADIWCHIFNQKAFA